MAVRAGTIRNEFAEPLSAYRSEEPADDDDDCTVIFDKDADISKIVFDGSRFSYDRHQVDDGLAVLEILCGTTPKTTLDSPEFVDIAKLSEITEKTTASSVQECDVLELSDDEDDDVVFVTEYREPAGSKEKPQQQQQVSVVVDDSDESKGSDSKIRRNPVRTARSGTKGKAKDVLFEEDFAFLDSSEDELEKKENKPPDTRPSTSTSLPKEWPINVHERPEYNPVTRRLELNGTFGDVKGKGAIKKSKMDVATVKRKATKSGTKRKKKSVPVDRVPIEKLKPLVNSTTDLLKEYFVNSKKHKDITNCQSEICTIENKLEILKNQAMLFSIVNNLDENEILKKFELLNVESEAKESN